MDKSLEIILGRLDEINERLLRVERATPNLYTPRPAPKKEPVRPVRMPRKERRKGTRDPSIPRPRQLSPEELQARQAEVHKKKAEEWAKREAEREAKRFQVLDRTYYSNAGRNKKVVSDIVEWATSPKRADGRLLVALTAEPAHAQKLAHLLRPSGLRTAVLVEDTENKIRTAVAERLTTGTVNISVADLTLFDLDFDVKQVGAWMWITPLQFNTQRHDGFVRWLLPRADTPVPWLGAYRDMPRNMQLQSIAKNLQEGHGIRPLAKAYRQVMLPVGPVI